MMKAKLSIFTVAMLTSIATFAFSEDAAPVYDADNYPPAFDSQPDTRPPMAPHSESAYVPDAPPPPAANPSFSFDQRMSRLEQQMNNLQRNNATSKVEALQGEVQALRGQVEQLAHQLQQMQTQQRTMYTDLDKRVSKAAIKAPLPEEVSSTPNSSEVKAVGGQSQQQDSLQKAKPKTSDMAKTDVSTTMPSASEKVDGNQPNVAEEQQIYQVVYDLIKANKYNEAIASVQKMLQKYPTGQFAANAHYWLGELYGLSGKSAQSTKEFESVIKNYPNSPKVSDAQLKLGLIYVTQSRWVDAKAIFKKIINRFPGTASARLASEQLKQIKAAGH